MTPVILRDVVEYLAQLLNVSAYNDIIHNGVHIEGTRPIASLATAVTASLQAIDQAAAAHTDLLLTHHGLFLKNAFVPLQNILRERVAHVINSGMHLLTYHLPLDAHMDYGNAWPTARALGWEKIEGFGEVFGKKIGVHGHLKETVSTQTLFTILQDFWKAEGICLGPSRPIRTVAFISGSGHKFVPEAIQMGIDCFITGTVDDITWHTVQESNIVVMAFGHYATETLGVQLLGNHLATRFGLGHRFIEECNPF